MNYYPFHIGDYVSATRHLSWEEDAAFRRLLDTYYTTEKPIPADLRAACRLVMAQTDSQREAVRVVLEEFFSLTDFGWINKRADAEIDAMRVKQQKQRDKANKRWHPPEPTRGNAAASEVDAAASEVDADAIPPTPTPAPIENLSEEANASSSSSATTGKSATPSIPCPYDAIVDAYHEALPSLPAVRLRDGKTWKARQRAMRELWGWVLSSRRSDGTKRADTGDAALQWIRAYFGRASENDFLMGRTQRSADHAGWRCDFDFLLTERGMKQVIERTVDAAA